MNKTSIKHNFNIFILTLSVNSIIFLIWFHSFNDSNWNFDQKITKKLLNKNYFDKLKRPKYEINCKSLIEMNVEELDKAIGLLNTLRYPFQENVELINDKNFIFNSSMCNDYKNLRGFDKLINISEQIELEFPLAYSISIYKNTEQIERLLRLIWRPQNYYCFHIDSKSTESFKQSIKSISNCFDNVFVSNKSEDIVWGSFSILQAELNCMQDLINRRGKINWKYLINMAGDEFPLKTNYELVKILEMYNGTNEIQIVNMNYLEYRYKYKYVLKKEGSDVNVRASSIRKSPPPHNFTIMKGQTYAILSREFCEFVLTNEKVQDLIEWSKDMSNPDEM